MISRSILSNYAWSLGSMAVSKGLRFMGVVLCIRLLGNYSWGQIASTLAFYTFLSLLVDQGLGSAPLLFRLQDRAADRRLLGIISGYRAAMAGLLIAAIFLVDRTVIPLGGLALTYAFVLLPRAINMEWWFHRRELYQVTMIIGAFRTLVFFFLVTAFVRRGSDPGTVILIELASETAAALAGFVALRFAPEGPPGQAAEAFNLRTLLIFSFPLFLISILNTVQAYMDIVLLKLFCGNEQVAQYDMGIKIGFLYFFLGSTMVQIIKPKITRLNHAGDTAKLGVILRAASSILVLLSAVFLVPSLYFPMESIELLFKGRHETAAFTFQWAAVWVSISFMTMLTSDTLLALGRRRDYFTGAWICAFTNIGMNVALLNGIGGQGAILAKIASEAVFLIWCHARLPAAVRAELRGVLLLQGAALAGFLAIYFLQVLEGTRLPWVMVSLACCLGLAVLSRTFSRETFAVLRDN